MIQVQLKTVRDTSGLDFNPDKYRGQQGEKSEERAQKHQKAADTYNKVKARTWICTRRWLVHKYMYFLYAELL